jgi:hypothetical protein
MPTFYKYSCKRTITYLQTFHLLARIIIIWVIYYYLDRWRWPMTLFCGNTTHSSWTDDVANYCAWCFHKTKQLQYYLKTAMLSVCLFNVREKVKNTCKICRLAHVQKNSWEFTPIYSVVYGRWIKAHGSTYSTSLVFMPIVINIFYDNTYRRVWYNTTVILNSVWGTCSLCSKNLVVLVRRTKCSARPISRISLNQAGNLCVLYDVQNSVRLYSLN